jgi:hypothetical protein
MALETADNRTALIQQTVKDLLTLNDPKVAAQMIADLVTRYAPSLASWAGEGICRRLMDCPERRAALAKLGGSESEKLGLFDHIRIVDEPVEQTVLLDAELMRVLVALGYGIQTLVYAVARQMTTGGDGSGRVRIADLVSQLKALGVAATARTIQRHWLAKGEGILWRISSERLYLIGYQKLCIRAVEMAVEAGRAELVITNPPGSRFIAVPITSPLTPNPSPTQGGCPSKLGRGEQKKRFANNILQFDEARGGFADSTVWKRPAYAEVVVWEAAGGVAQPPRRPHDGDQPLHAVYTVGRDQEDADWMGEGGGD